MFNVIFDSQFKNNHFNHEFLTSNNKFYWDQFSEDLPFLPVHYDSNFIFYHYEYLISTNVHVENISSIIFFENKPVAVWPIFIVCNNGVWRLQVNEPLVSHRISPIQNRKINAIFLSTINVICKKLNCESTLVQGFYGNTSTQSEWSRLLWSQISEVSLRQELLVDLTSPIETIRKQFRKSYLSLIKKYKKNLTIKLFRKEITQEIWDEFRRLHEREAGRTTRSIQSWNLQLSDVKSNKAFYIRVSNEEDEIIGGSFFLTTRQEVLYGVAAYDRSLTNVPIGHVSIERAILEGIEQGCIYLRLGSWPQNFAEKCSDKEMGILNFKKGFATKMALVCDYKIYNV